MIITIVKTAYIDVGDVDIEDALDEADAIDSDGAVPYEVDYYDEEGNLLN